MTKDSTKLDVMIDELRATVDNVEKLRAAHRDMLQQVGPGRPATFSVLFKSNVQEEGVPIVLTGDLAQQTASVAAEAMVLQIIDSFEKLHSTSKRALDYCQQRLAAASKEQPSGT